MQLEGRVLIDWVSAGSLAKLDCAIVNSPERYYLEVELLGEEGEEDNDLETFDLSTMSRFRLLSHLSLDGKASGDASSLQNLTQLQHLNLNNTQVGGSLSDLRNLTQLRYLTLTNIGLSGTLDLRDLTQLRYLTLGDIEASGTLSDLQNLTQLRRLILSDIVVSGTLSDLQNLAKLQRLKLSRIQVSGSITSLPQLTDLAFLSIINTQVAVPTQQQIAVFQQQHPECRKFYFGPPAYCTDIHGDIVRI